MGRGDPPPRTLGSRVISPLPPPVGNVGVGITLPGPPVKVGDTIEGITVRDRTSTLEKSIVEVTGGGT